jgi:hypothetical protein
MSDILSRLQSAYQRNPAEVLNLLPEFFDSVGKMVFELPCEVGDTIYEIDMPEYGVIECEVTHVSAFSGYLCGVKQNGKAQGIVVNVTVIKGHGISSTYYFELNDFGKTVFLTEQAAKDALERGKGNDN